ncbi:glycosyltransferase [Oceanibaculum pacificum]|uniref:Uncharacterized protein n=1 Tax=Oceanibaculum pacificum TaxID=580166 RepID=A0A154VYU1_9PROT|nr:glycosyltransferase [Oceanibaculum pacificum]KZD06418.1 hypothetical protein AUP43_10870 [Oceanibaculum pacificum]
MNLPLPQALPALLPVQRLGLGPGLALAHFHALRPWRGSGALACRNTLDPVAAAMGRPAWRVLALWREAGEQPLSAAAKGLDARSLAAITAFLIDAAPKAGLLDGPAYPEFRAYLMSQAVSAHPVRVRHALEAERQALEMAPLNGPFTVLALGEDTGWSATWQADPLAPETRRLTVPDAVPLFCFAAGRLLRLVDMPGAAQPDDPHAAIAALSENLPLPITRLMLALWHMRPDLQAAYPLPEKRALYLAWCLSVGVRDYPALLDAPGWSPSALALAVYAARPDLQVAFDLRHRSGLEGFAGWLRHHGRQEAPALAAPRPRRAPRPETGGVTILGHASAAMGIGEDARQAAGALAVVGVPVQIVDVPPGGAPLEMPRYRAMLLCLTGFEALNLLGRCGAGYLDGRKTIGLLPWELPAWPARFGLAYAALDEIWAMSGFLAGCWRRDAPVPVIAMPPAVAPPRPVTLGRAQFGLPADHFLFHAGFDGNSTLVRKNPLGAVRAFRRAFPRRRSVGLVLKAMNAGAGTPGWSELVDAIDDDPRIFLLNRRMSRPEADALLACCDAHLALHRAEGFGRIPAEAMLLGKPVIATGWSGTADFVTPETGFPVEYGLTPSDYPFGDGQLWAEPDMAQAAQLMRTLVSDRTESRRIALAGQQLIRARHDPAEVGRRYRARLERLGWL